MAAAGSRRDRTIPKLLRVWFSYFIEDHKTAGGLAISRGVAGRPTVSF
jgi:hypothetical protein